MAAFTGGSGGKEVLMTGREYRDLPLVARGDLDALRDDLAAPELYRTYVGQYLQMWPRRCQRLVSALDIEDKEALMDAVLSIKTSAGMLGAVRLEQLALNIEDAARNGRMDRARSFLAELDMCGELTTEQLRCELQRGD